MTYRRIEYETYIDEKLARHMVCRVGIENWPGEAITKWVQNYFSKFADPWSSWHEFEKREAVMDKLCDTDVVLRRIPWKELWDFVLEPTVDDGGILEMDDEPPRSISDSGIKDLLRLQYGIVNVMDVQNLEKNQRNKIIKEICDQGAGFRQLARITGISYGIIQRVVTDQSPLIYDGRSLRQGKAAMT